MKAEVVVSIEVTRRGTSNGNARGSSTDRRRRREWLVFTYRADVDAQRHGDLPGACGYGEGIAACRCYRCGTLLTVETVTVDRIIPGCEGGTYRRNNIRPACGTCNSETGGALAHRNRKAA
jgi:5-methylcytosine-specific restriction endonuclease McrA